VNAVLWFLDQRVRVFPIRQGSKEPACKSWDDFECTREEAAAFTNYGVALGPVGYGVCDTDTPESEEWAAAHLPHTPFKVRTARGVHRYYRLLNPAPKFIHRDELTIEFRNAGQYVLGPGSLHPSGAVYVADDWSWRLQEVPIFSVEAFEWDDRPYHTRGSAVGSTDGYKTPDEIKAGQRHDEMYRMCRALKIRGVPVEGATQACIIENQIRCKPPLPQRAIQKHLHRVYHQPNRSGWIGYKMDAWGMFNTLAESGFSRDALVAAAQSMDPSFDPENPPTYHTSQEAVDLRDGEQDMYGRHWTQLTVPEGGWPPGEHIVRNGEWIHVPARREVVKK